jgi:hypothetical protein
MLRSRSVCSKACSNYSASVDTGVTDTGGECGSQSSLDRVDTRPNRRTDRYVPPVALDLRTEFVELLRAGLLGDAPQRPHIDLVV